MCGGPNDIVTGFTPSCHNYDCYPDSETKERCVLLFLRVVVNKEPYQTVHKPNCSRFAPPRYFIMCVKRVCRNSM